MKKSFKRGLLVVGIVIAACSLPAIFEVSKFVLYSLELTLKRPKTDCDEVVFDPSKTGKVLTCQLKAPAQVTYGIRIGFAWPPEDKIERVRIGNLIDPPSIEKDGRFIKPGAPMDVQITISKKGGEIFHKQIIKSPVSDAGGADFKYLPLLLKAFPPGEYIVEIENVRSSPELKGLSARLFIGFFGPK